MGRNMKAALAWCGVGAAIVLSGIALYAAVPSKNTLAPSAPPRSIDVPRVTLEQLVERVRGARGKIVVVHVWATWCPKCVHEIPVINALAANTRPEDVEIINISDDDVELDLGEFLEKNRFVVPTIRMVPDQAAELEDGIEDLGGHYRRKLPYTLVLKRTGEVADEWSGPRSLKFFREKIDPWI
jgi:thiol-disulfide isomerase/thioredoxin